jgi:hypothetical protein
MSLGYAEEFRVLGQWLDNQSAEDVEILVSDISVTVRWKDAVGVDGVRSFDPVELVVLSEVARRDRRNPFGEMQGEWAAALRTLGKELEESRLEPLLVRSLAGGLQVYAQQDGAPQSAWYDKDRLLDWNRMLRSQRMVAHLRRSAHRGARWWDRWREALPFAHTKSD